MKEIDWFIVTLGYNYDKEQSVWFKPSKEPTEHYYAERHMYGSSPISESVIYKLQTIDFPSMGRHEMMALYSTYKEQLKYYNDYFMRDRESKQL
jgi:hypothetical protein